MPSASLPSNANLRFPLSPAMLRGAPMKGEKGEKFRRGIEHFNRGEFFTCHEVLEEIWLAETPAEKPFYQGLIQAAAAFHHLHRGNRRGAASLLARGLAKLEKFSDDHDGLALEPLRVELRRALEALGKSRRGKPTKPIEPPRIGWA